MKNQELINLIIDRADKMQTENGFGSIKDRQSDMMDIESAVFEFNIDLEELLEADDFNFAHDYFGIRKHIIRDTYPATNFSGFIPRYSRT